MYKKENLPLLASTSIDVSSPAVVVWAVDDSVMVSPAVISELLTAVVASPDNDNQ